MDDVVYRPIGVIHSPHKDPEGMPIQPRAALGVQGRVEVFPEFAEGLADLSGFSHIHLLYHLHRVAGVRLTVVPFLDTKPRGVFATRAPSRPNPLGLSVVRLREVRGQTLLVENLDVLDDTPLLDIKPYAPALDHWEVDSIGWLTDKDLAAPEAQSDDRFSKD
jgi:tRNA-Thr(GGU) m(6)t(6)A37 methyltransferase TsaA